jgi:hypothetical protein
MPPVKDKATLPKWHLWRRCEKCRQACACIFTVDPYAAEIGDDFRKAWYCEPCLSDMRDSI